MENLNLKIKHKAFNSKSISGLVELINDWSKQKNIQSSIPSICYNQDEKEYIALIAYTIYE